MAGLSGKNLARMLNDSKFSDIILLSSDGQKFHAATRILQSNCPYFVVAQNLEKGINGVLALDIRGNILAEVRRWIYIKTIDAQKFELEDLLDLHSIADSYGLEDLKDKAEDLLSEYPISEENVLKILQRADEVGNQKLMKRCMNYLCENIQNLLQNTKVFNKIPSDLIIEINKKVSLQKIPDYYVAIGKWAKIRQTSVARKVFQETLNFEEMPKEILVDVIKKLKDENIVTGQLIRTLTSEISNSLTSSNENLIKLDNIENILWNVDDQIVKISKETSSRILNEKQGIWFYVGQSGVYKETQSLEILFKEPMLVNQLSWRLYFLTDLYCVALFGKNDEELWSAKVNEKIKKPWKNPEILKETGKCMALKFIWADPLRDIPNRLHGVILNKSVQIHKIRFQFKSIFKFNSLFANCIKI